MEDDRPKDYPEVQTLEEWLDSGYGELNTFQKIVYHLQDYVLVYIFAAFAAGYLAGLFVGN